MAEEQGKYRRVFLDAYGSGPHSCFFCGNIVVRIFIHHINEDHFDHRPENLAACHASCHTTHHHKGRPKPGVRSDSRTGHKNIKPYKGSGFLVRWQCLVCDVRFYVGRSKDWSLEDAILAQKKYREDHMNNHTEEGEEA